MIACWHTVTSGVSLVVVPGSVLPAGAGAVNAAHTEVSLTNAVAAVASAASTCCCAASTACWSAASCGSVIAALSTMRLPAPTLRDDVAVADAPAWFVVASPDPLLPEMPAPPAPPLPPIPPTLSPANAFDSVSRACASAACLVWRACVSAWVSSDASVPLASTGCPTWTLTDATVPLTGKATVACATGSIVATPSCTESTLRVATVAVR